MSGEPKRHLGVALIGCGGIAGAHFRAISQEPRVRLIAVADIDQARARAAADKHGPAEVHTSWESLWQHEEIEAVILCLPHSLHAPAAVSALEAGRHVLVEKPIANTTAEAEAMIEAAQAHDRVLMVGHMKRFNRAMAAMQRAVAGGQIGDPFSFEVVYYGPREIMPGIPWVRKKATGGGGPLMGFGTHHLDLLRWLFGEVGEVSAFTTRAVVENADVEDTAAACLRFQSGVIGVMHFTWARAVQDFRERICVLGSKGEIVVSDGQEISMASEPRFGDRKLHTLDPSEEAADLPEDQFAGELAHFVDCVQSGAAPRTDGPSARRTLAVIEAAYRSAETGRTVTVEP